MQRGVPDTDRLFLSILSCVFSSDTNVVDTVLDAFYNLLLNEKSRELTDTHPATHTHTRTRTPAAQVHAFLYLYAFRSVL